MKRLTRPCAAKRKDGRKCETPARPGRKHCTFHDPALEAELAEGRRQGGVTRATRPNTLPPDAPDLPLSTAADVVAALGETFNLVRTGRMDARVGNCLAVIASSLLRAVEGRQLEGELDELKKTVNEMAGNRRRGR